MFAIYIYIFYFILFIYIHDIYYLFIKPWFWYFELQTTSSSCTVELLFIGLGYKGKDSVFRFITEYSSLRDFGPWVIIGLFLYEDF